MALNVTNLITNVLPLLHTDSAANAVFTTDSELTRFFDEALKAHARKHCVFVKRDTTTVTFASTQAAYDLPARCLAVMHVALANVPLLSSSSYELEVLTDFLTSELGTPTYWYTDRAGSGKIAFYLVPTTPDVGNHPEIIYMEYPADLDTAHVNTDVPVPQPVGDYLELAVLRAAYAKESDFALPEVAQNITSLLELFDRAIVNLWGAGRDA